MQIYSPRTPNTSNNYSISKTISLQEWITSHFLIESSDEKLGDFLYNSILDLMVDKISTENAYHDFSVALEGINSLLKTWKLDNENIWDIDVVISVIHKADIMFSQNMKRVLYTYTV